MKKLAVWFLTLLFVMQIAVPLGTGAAAHPTYTIASLVTVARYMTGQISLTPAEIAQYDVDGNGWLNIADMTRMALIIVGQAVPEPPGASISDQEAMDLALSLVPGAAQSDIRAFRRGLKNGQLVYEVDIAYDGFTYEAVISGKDGTFLEWGFEQIEVAPAGTTDIGLDAARQIALDRVPGASAADITELKRETEDGVPVYAGTILHGGREYEFEIHASTGTFIKWGYEVTDRAPAGPSAEPMPTVAPSELPSASPVPMPTYSPQRQLTAEEARDIALSYVPGAGSESVVGLELDREDGRLVYEGEIRHDGVRYVFDLDAYTGQRLAWYMESPPEPGPAGVDIGMARAQAIALAQVPGATEADITECDRSTENGVPVYEVELRSGGFKYAFEIVASTGVVCKSGFEVISWQAVPTMVPAPTGTPRPLPTMTAAPGAEIISADRAKEIALSQVPGAAAQHVTQCRLEREDGLEIYEVEIRYGGVEYEFDIDALTGVIIRHDSDHTPGRPTPAPAPALSYDAAQQLVLERVPGASAADFREFRLDRDGVRLIYEGELYYDGVEENASASSWFQPRVKRAKSKNHTMCG